MFFGTTTVQVKQYLAEEIKRQKTKKVIEPFAGNFVLSATCGVIDKKIEVLSSDVSMYSVQIGCALSDQVAPINPIWENIKKDFPLLSEKKTPMELATLLVFLLEAGNNKAKMKHKYYRSLFEHVKNNQEEYFDEIFCRITNFKEQLGNFKFYPQDGCKTIEEANEGDIVFYDPPFFLGDYEKMFKVLDEYFTMTDLKYTIVNEDVIKHDLNNLNKRGVTVYYRPEKPVKIEGFEKAFEHQQRHDKIVYVYSNNLKKAKFSRRSFLNDTNDRFDLLFQDDVLKRKTKAELISIDVLTSNHYRLMWTKKAEMRRTGYPFGYFLDGKLAGIVVIDSPSARQYKCNHMCIIADPATLYSNYKRISKALLYSVLTHEFREYLEDKFIYKFEHFRTTAFSNFDVSMKYRGLFKLTERRNGADVGMKFKLDYCCEEMVADTIQQGYELWFDKYGGKKWV